MKQRILELNASDERGINVVRSKIKSFAQYTVNKDAKESGYPCPPYKIIILDEADSMTRDAQTALRRTMEKYSNVTRFCLICNYVSRIIAPVASRCSKFRFQSLSQESMTTKLTEIATSEKLALDDDVMEELITMSGGDMRKSITLLQSSSLMKSAGEKITLSDLHTVAVRIPDHVIHNKILKACTSKTYQTVNDTAHWIISEGYPVSLILSKLMDVVMMKTDMFNNLGISEIALKIAKADRCLVDGASEFLQLLDVMGCIQESVLKEYKDNKQNDEMKEDGDDVEMINDDDL